MEEVADEFSAVESSKGPLTAPSLKNFEEKKTKIIKMLQKQK